MFCYAFFATVSLSILSVASQINTVIELPTPMTIASCGSTPLEVLGRLRKTRVGRIALAVTNLAFLAILFTAVYSAIPPAFNFSPPTLTATPTSWGQTYTVGYAVTNNGFYEIENFYVVLSINDPTNNLVNATSSTPVAVPRSQTSSGTIAVSISTSYIGLHNGTYTITLAIHSEFAYGLIKFTIDVPQTVSLHWP